MENYNREYERWLSSDSLTSDEKDELLRYNIIITY